MISASMFWSFLVLVITYSSIIQAVKGSPWSSFSCSRMILRFGAIRFASSFLMQVLLYRILDLRIHLVLMHRVSLRLAGWSWRLELEWCERKILLGWLELELMTGVL